MALHIWWLFVVTVFFVSASPGPNMLHVMARSIDLGLARSTMAMAGCFSAVILLIGSSAAGLGALLIALPGVFTVLRLAGAAYLVWLGVTSWRAPVAADSESLAGDDRTTPAVTVFRHAFAVGISNPKALLFAAAFLPQFIDPARPQVPQLAIMLATFTVIEITWYFIYALGGRHLAQWLRSPARRQLFNRINGGIFVVFGAALAATRA